MTLEVVSMITPTYDPKVGWSRLISVTFGTFPSYEEFEARFSTVCADSDNSFSFENDPYVGSDKLTCEQLWDELQKQYWLGDEQAEAWCSSVMGSLGWEWVLYVRHHKSG